MCGDERPALPGAVGAGAVAPQCGGGATSLIVPLVRCDVPFVSCADTAAVAFRRFALRNAVRARLVSVTFTLRVAPRAIATATLPSLLSPTLLSVIVPAHAPTVPSGQRS